jgi:hypothetical protein
MKPAKRGMLGVGYKPKIKVKVKGSEEINRNRITRKRRIRKRHSEGFDEAIE